MPPSGLHNFLTQLIGQGGGPSGSQTPGGATLGNSFNMGVPNAGVFKSKQIASQIEALQRHLSELQLKMTNLMARTPMTQQEYYQRQSQMQSLQQQMQFTRQTIAQLQGQMQQASSEEQQQNAVGAQTNAPEYAPAPGAKQMAAAAQQSAFGGHIVPPLYTFQVGGGAGGAGGAGGGASAMGGGGYMGTGMSPSAAAWANGYNAPTRVASGARGGGGGAGDPFAALDQAVAALGGSDLTSGNPYLSDQQPPRLGSPQGPPGQSPPGNDPFTGMSLYDWLQMMAQNVGG